MQAVYFLGNRELDIADIPDPTPGPGEVILEIKASGMCGSDLRVYRAADPLRMIAGHEPCGVVAEVGPGVTERDARIGQRVMNHHYTGCGACRHCLDNEDIIRTQKTLMGSWTFSIAGQAQCARFCVDRDIDVDALFTHRWSLDQAREAYELFDAQSAGKGVFER